MVSAPATLQPLTLWEKIKEGVSGFVKTALAAAPRTLLYSALFMGGSYALGTMTNGAFDPFGATKFGSFGDWALRIGASMALGSAISGAVGAYECVSTACKERDAYIVAAGQQPQVQVPQQQMSYSAPHAPQAGLPTGVPIGKTQASQVGT